MIPLVSIKISFNLHKYIENSKHLQSQVHCTQYFQQGYESCHALHTGMTDQTQVTKVHQLSETSSFWCHKKQLAVENTAFCGQAQLVGQSAICISY